MTKKTRAHLIPGDGGWGVLSYDSDGGARRKISRTPEGYQNLVLWASPKFISTPKRYQINNNKLYAQEPK